jgi:hypothetical protein
MYEDFELEIEAIQSMYDNVSVYDPSSSSSSSSSSLSSSSYHRIIELTLAPRVLASSSFVEVTIQINIPISYVTQNIDTTSDDSSFIPKVVLMRTSGLADEGKQLLQNIHKLHVIFLPGTIYQHYRHYHNCHHY